MPTYSGANAMVGTSPKRTICRAGAVVGGPASVGAARLVGGAAALLARSAAPASAGTTGARAQASAASNVNASRGSTLRAPGVRALAPIQLSIRALTNNEPPQH